MEDEFLKCPFCKNEFDIGSCDRIEWYYDDEDNEGHIKWDVRVTCPHCGESYYEEIWD